MRTRLSRNSRGVSPVVSSLILFATTIVGMLLVISSSTLILNTYRERMTERLVVEKVLVTSDQDTVRITMYLRNTGHIDITLRYYIVNGSPPTPLGEPVTLLSLEANPYAEATAVVLDLTKPLQPSVYLISFFSSRNNELGNIEVEYS